MNQIIKGEQITVEVDLAHGARLSSVKWDGREFSVQKRENTLHWGWYPMAPWAGRVLYGKFRRASGEEVQLPTNVIPPHAIHGLAYDLVWQDCGNGVSRVDFPACIPSAIAVAGSDYNYDDGNFIGLWSNGGSDVDFYALGVYNTQVKRAIGTSYKLYPFPKLPIT